MSLYLIVVLLVIAGPLALSFEKNLRLYKRWKYLLPAILVTMLVFVAWDIAFTYYGCWQFNPMHNSGIYFFELPLEEYLFFISIPYACAFTFYAVQFHFPNYKASLKLTKLLSATAIVASVAIAAMNVERTYTFISFLVVALFIALAFKFARKVLQYYWAIFPIIAVPFLIVNGVLTGSGIEQEVFSYDADKISGVFLWTIPIEDLIYAFSLILSVLGLCDYIERRDQKNQLT